MDAELRQRYASGCPAHRWRRRYRGCRAEVMIILLRLLPFLAALLQALAFFLQVQSPQTYPYLAAGGVLLVPVAAFILSWQRVRLGDLLEKMLPTLVLHVALAFGLLLVEGPLPVLTIVLLAGLSTFVSL